MQGVRASRDGVASPEIHEIRAQLERILSSGEFHAPDRGRRFIEFIVEETLAGRADYLKAYTIAQEVFAREPSFDAQNDPVVRIEAGRIRRALERYYLVAGSDDRVVITIPKGGYVPSFVYAAGACEAASHRPPARPVPAVGETAEPGAPPPPVAQAGLPSWIGYAAPACLSVAGLLALLYNPASSWIASTQALLTPPGSEATLPKVVVEPFRDTSEQPASSDIAQALTDEVIGQLAKFREIVVVTRSAPDAPEGARFALQGSVRLEEEKMRLVVRLVRRYDGAVVWASNYDADFRTQGRLDVEADVAERIATAVAQPYGVIFQTDAADISKSSSGDWDAYACTLSYYSYRADLNPKNHAAVRDCLEQATERLPTYSTYWALLSLTYIDEVRFQYRLGAPSSPHALSLAYDAARRATDLDPQNARGLQALMLASFFRNDVDAALRAGAAAYAINPNDTEVAGEYGFRLAMSGKWDTGCELMASSISKNSGPSGYYEVGMALCAYMRGDNQAAELWARMADLKYNPMHHLVLLAVLGALGKLDEARQEQDWLQANAPLLIENIGREVKMRLHRPEDQERFLDGLRAAGLAVPSAGSAVARQ